MSEKSIVIRTLRADEIECRVGTDKNNKVLLLLYKDARVDMNMLDEIFGIDGWQRTHEVINNNLFCTVKIWSEKTNSWICKQDVGTESNTEKEKGEASDSFKRACFNIGIGRELYSSPVVKFSTTEADYWTPQGGKPIMTSKFTVKEIGYNDNKEINALTIVDQKGKERYKLGQVAKEDEAPRAKADPTKSEEYQDNLIFAIEDVEASQATHELEAVWNKWERYQKDSKFGMAYAKMEIKFATTTEALKALWEKWKMLQTETAFATACTTRRIEIQKPKQ